MKGATHVISGALAPRLLRARLLLLVVIVLEA